MFCSKCGNEVAEGSGFCSKCGSPVDSGSTQPIQEKQVSGGTAESPSKETAPAKKKKKRKVIIPIVIVLLVAVIGVAAAFATDGFGLLGDSDAESSDNTEVSYETEEAEESDTEAEDAESDESDDEIKDSVDDYTWEELSAISAEIAAASDEDEAIEIAKTYNLVNEDGTLDGTHQTKSVTLTNGAEISVQIVGFAHDDKSDGSGKAGITFMFTDAIAELSMNSDNDNTGGWESSSLRSWLSSEGIELLPEDLQDVIVAVDKSTNNVGETDDASSVSTTSDELWLFSYAELVGKSNASYAAILNAEGSQYQLFSDCGVTYNDSNDILTMTYQSGSSLWWQRSSDPDSSRYFMYVYTDGNPDYTTSASGSYAVVPGFCI